MQDSDALCFQPGGGPCLHTPALIDFVHCRCLLHTPTVFALSGYFKYYVLLHESSQDLRDPAVSRACRKPAHEWIAENRGKLAASSSVSHACRKPAHEWIAENRGKRQPAGGRSFLFMIYPALPKRAGGCRFLRQKEARNNEDRPFGAFVYSERPVFYEQNPL